MADGAHGQRSTPDPVTNTAKLVIGTAQLAQPLLQDRGIMRHARRETAPTPRRLCEKRARSGPPRTDTTTVGPGSTRRTLTGSGPGGHGRSRRPPRPRRRLNCPPTPRRPPAALAQVLPLLRQEVGGALERLSAVADRCGRPARGSGSDRRPSTPRAGRGPLRRPSSDVNVQSKFWFGDWLGCPATLTCELAGSDGICS